MDYQTGKTRGAFEGGHNIDGRVYHVEVSLMEGLMARIQYFMVSLRQTDPVAFQVRHSLLSNTIQTMAASG